jgi:A/G-specific adenine glycosylase
LLAALVERDGALLLFRRPDGEEVLAGTWELPWVEADAGADPERALAGRYGLAVTLGETLGTVRHSITTRRLVVTVRRARPGAAAAAPAAVAEGREARWVAAAELASLPVSSLVGKALRLAGAARI